jgi:hypothetical protein
VVSVIAATNSIIGFFVWTARHSPFRAKQTSSALDEKAAVLDARRVEGGCVLDGSVELKVVVLAGTI